MKKLRLYTLLTLAVLTACDNETSKKLEEPVTLAPNSKIYVSCKATKADENGLETAEYIVKNSAYMRVKPLTETSIGRMDLGSQEDNYESHRDLANNKFVFYGSDAVTDDGEPGSFFQCEDVTFVVSKVDGKRMHPIDAGLIPIWERTEDTIAYVPNAVVMKCKEDILKAIAAGDHQEAYRVMMEDFVFIPIKDGAEWRRLEGK